jgi:hypothetical protein
MQWLDGADGSWYSTAVTTKDSWTLLTAYRPAKATAWGVAIGNGTVESVDTKTFYADNISVREVTGTNIVYTATGDYTTKDSGLILSGATDYKYPQRPSGDYGRIVMAAESKYDAKIIKYLDAKRGRAYQLGPELAIDGGFSSSSGWTIQTGCAVADGVATFTAVANGAGVGRLTSSGLGAKTYLFSYNIPSFTAGTHGYYLGGATRNAAATGAGHFEFVISCPGSNNYFYVVSGSASSTFTVDNVSVREILL